MATTTRPPRALSPAQQALGLRTLFPQSSVTVRATGVVWVGAIRPTPLSRTYTVRVTYTVDDYPTVLVLDPPLEPREGEPLPHTFHGGSLCLHEDHEWTPTKHLVDTILPWTAEWLAHYELWKATGQWHGDGAPRATDEIALTSQVEQHFNRANRRAAQRAARRDTPQRTRQG
ncbi:MAG TPA: hypothetical protein VGD71_39920 [Kribbella sp.]|jgi:hypothetical protein